MLTGMKVSSLARKCVFYRSTLTGKWGPYGIEIKFLKFKTEMYQRIELKDYVRGVIRLNVKNGSFYVPSARSSKISVPVWARHLNAFERLYLALSENNSITQYYFFCNNSILFFLCTYIYFPNCDKLFVVISRKYKKIAISDILKAIAMEVKMMTRQATTFFSFF